MARKALLVGVSTYPSSIPQLTAPAREVRFWGDTLTRHFGFSVDQLVDPAATRHEVLRRLRTLFDGASQGDELLVLLAGHGTQAMSWVDDDVLGSGAEDAVILYDPSGGKKPIQYATITPGDFTRLLKEHRRPPFHLYTVVDSCFAGSFVIHPPTFDRTEANPQSLFVKIEGAVSGPALSFYEVFNALHDETFQPVLVAAAGPDRPAAEVGSDSDRRMLFSRNALSVIRDARLAGKSLTSTELVDTVNRTTDLQQAVLVATANDAKLPFAGGLLPDVVQDALAPFSHAVDADGLASAFVAFQIFGFGTLIDLPPSPQQKHPFRNRVLFPRDTFAAEDDPEHHHLAVEVREDDFVFPPAGRLPQTRILRGGVRYSRWDLDRHRISVGNVNDDGSPVQPEPGFWDHVPRLTYVTPELTDKTPRPETFDDFPDGDYFTGFLDLLTGDAALGDSNEVTTDYIGEYSRKLRIVQLNATGINITVPIDGGFAVIQIEDGSNSTATIWVRSGSTVVIGNARDTDFDGPGTNDSRPEHFKIYYRALFGDTLHDPGVPVMEAVPINACTVTGFP